jgi:hypothetical protein
MPWVGVLLLGCVDFVSVPVQSVHAQTSQLNTASTQSVSPQTPATPDSVLLSFEQQIATEDNDHRLFLERMDNKLEDDALKLGGAIVALVTGLFVFFGFTKIKDLQEATDRKINAIASEEATRARKDLQEFSEKLKTEYQKLFVDEIMEIRKKMEEFTRASVGNQAEISGLVTESLIALSVIPSGAPSDRQKEKRQKLIGDLKEALAKYPGNRDLAIQLARQLHEYYEPNLPAAIQIIRGTLAEREKIRERDKSKPDKDDAALFYNLACYENLLAKDYDSNSDKEPDRTAEWKAEAVKLRQQAVLDIQNAIKIDPDNAADAKDDEDLRGLVF